LILLLIFIYISPL